MRREVAIRGTWWVLQRSARIAVENGKVTEVAGSGGLIPRPAGGAQLQVSNREIAPSYRGAGRGAMESRTSFATLIHQVEEARPDQAGQK